MIRQIPHTHRAEMYEMVVRLFKFLCIGGVGAIVNLLCFSGVYYPLLEVANSFIAYGIAFIVGTEVSILSNFILNDRLTFGDLHARSWQARCLRYHVTSMGGVLLTLGSSFALIHLLHVPALPAQATVVLTQKSREGKLANGALGTDQFGDRHVCTSYGDCSR